ncbi:hypothetical protein VTI74DRAFT_3820 [Chaetomium olivicolor]
MSEIIPIERGQEVTADLQARFERINIAYKTVNNTPIETAILVPKKLLAKSPDSITAVPVLVHFHGGGLRVGTNPEPFFLADWVRDLAHQAPAIFLSPAYRLVPESRAVDALSDVADFWTWLRDPAANPLNQLIFSRWPHLVPDMDRVAAIGESAGGFLALQSALQFNRVAKLRAVIAQYPACFTDLQVFNRRPEEPRPEFDRVVDEYVKNMKEGELRVSSPWPETLDFFIAVSMTGRSREMFGDDPEGRLTLRYALEQAEEVPPPMWVVQGDKDGIVPREATDEMVERIRRERPKAVVKYTVRPGDHGFDVLNTLQDDWVKEGVDFVKGEWLYWP